jgi:hypothetical protein
MTRIRFAAALLLGSLAVGVAPAPAQVAESAGSSSVTDDLAPLIRSLFAVIEMLSEYRAPDALPPVFQLPQHLLEAKICDEPCDVSAAYVPREGVYIAGNLDPLHDPLDRAALVHELVHYLQQGHPNFAHLTGCERERAKEQEAYAIQNAYLATLGSSKRVAFYDGDFDCGGRAPAR